jgi:hypothetical protein
MPSQNMPVQSNPTAGLTLLWACKPLRGCYNYSKSYKKKPDGLFPKEDWEREFK